jgi:hypothetical protein
MSTKAPIPVALEGDRKPLFPAGEKVPNAPVAKVDPTGVHPNPDLVTTVITGSGPAMPARPLVPTIGATTAHSNSTPAFWDIVTDEKDPEIVNCKNNITGKEFRGTPKQFSKMLRGE